MKYALIACLIILFGCKKEDEKAERQIQIIGNGSSWTCDLHYSKKATKKDGDHNGGSFEGYNNGKAKNFKTDKGYSYEIIVSGKVDSFTCTMIVNGDQVYFAKGKDHKLSL